MPMIWTAGNLAFLVCVGAVLAFLALGEILEARRARDGRDPTGGAEPARRRPWRERRLPAAALRRLALD
ncbi:MAG TPA: hypothetical protein VEI03_16070 [Stellaceae bacterium]|nr:hypothetical protein [Stellaceae bacterium]